MLVAYVLIPLFLLRGPVEADAHSLKALHVSANGWGIAWLSTRRGT